MENKNITRRFGGYIYDTVHHLIVWRDTLWSALSDRTIKQWNYNGNCLKTRKGHTGLVLLLFVWRDLLHCVSDDKTILVWNFDGECLRKLKGHTSYVDCLTSWRDFLISGSDDKTVRVWNSEGECVAQWTTGSEVRTMIEWNGLLCTGQGDSSIKLWNEFNKCIQTLNGHTEYVRNFVVHEDYLFSGTLLSFTSSPDCLTF